MRLPLRFVTLLISASAPFWCGCVHRVMMIRSEPDGALVSIDRQTVGHTPVAVPFTYYGTRDIRLEKDGYQPLEVQERLRTPWYDVFPLSFFTNHFALREIRDQRDFHYQLAPQNVVDENQLLQRADQLRLDVHRGTVALPLDAAR